MRTIKLKSGFELYNYCKPYVIAEIGANHNGNMQLAKEQIISAKECGADCVKFQSWTPDSLVSKSEYEKNQVYTDSKKKHFGSLKEMVDKYALTTEQHYELKKFCDEINIDFASSPFSIEEARLLNDLDVPFFKIASMDINNHPFLYDVAKLGKPMILSTGMSTLAEIESAIDICKKAGNEEVIILHCISIYPPEYSDINLNNIPMLQNTFDLPVGFSDHTIGTSIPLASVALGACIIEKHFTLDKDLPGWDHEISANPEELIEICTESKNIQASLGSHKRIVSSAEEEKKKKFRRSLVFSKDLSKGHVITENDLTAKRPGTHISPDKLEFIVGRTLTSDVQYDDLVDWSMF